MKMSMTASPNEENSGKILNQPWPGRFQVRAEVSYRDRRGKTASMHIITFQPEMLEEEIAALLAPLGYIPGVAGYNRIASQAKDTFSQEQVEQLLTYLETRRGTKARMQQAPLPTPTLIGASAIPALPSFRDGTVYCIYLEPGYKLPFKVESINVKTYISMARLFQEMKEQF